MLGYLSATLSQNCLLLGTDNAQGQICEHVMRLDQSHASENISWIIIILTIIHQSGGE